MINRFRYSLNEQDYLSFESFKIKKSKSLFVSYIFCLIFLVIGVYNAVVYETVLMVVASVIVIAFVALNTFVTTKIRPQKRVKRMIGLDPSYFGENEIAIGEKTIETKNIPNENESAVVTVYPYGLMNAIFENESYFYFLISNEVKILPKRVIPNEMKETVFSLIKNNQNYVYVK